MKHAMAGSTGSIVLIVDDDIRVRKSIESLVRSAGYAPLTFSSGEEFIESGSLAYGKCLITDVRMPGMSGLELQRRVRRERPELPVIFISAHRDDKAQKRALAEGGLMFFYKPFEVDDLLRAIQVAVNES